jgi:hypothetical protein
MGRLKVRAFVHHTTWHLLAMLICATGAASASGQIATTTTATMTPIPVFVGETPVVTITVTAADGSTPPGSSGPDLYTDVSCSILARGHNAAYATNLQNGVAQISLSTVAEDPVDYSPTVVPYTLSCNYVGSATYAASSAALIPFRIINSTVWIVNSDSTISLLNYSGGVLETQGTPGPAATAGGIAIDANSDAWAVTNASNSLVFVNSIATASSTYTGGGLLQPVAVAIDGAGQVWIANGGNSVSAFSNTGVAQSPTTGYGATVAAATTPYNAPSSIAVDQAGSIWITNAGGNSVTRIFGSAAPASAPLITTTVKGSSGITP